MSRGLVLFIFLLSVASPYTFSNVEKRRSQIISVIDEELKEVSRLSSQYKHRNPRLLLRIAELFLEKARLLRDYENKKYLSIPPEERRKINKNTLFKGSSSYFSRAQKTCSNIIKKFPKFKYKADVYYILAYNAKEFKQNKKAKRYFELSLKYSRKGSKTYQKASIALAEIYFNEKNYKKALPFYDKGVKGKKDKWWTKDTFNLAWTYFQRKQYSKAISLMREIHTLSADSKYVDMRPQVERDIGLFYIEANQFDEAVSFYEGLNKNISTVLINLGKILIDKGKPSQSEKALVRAKKYAKGNELTEVNLTLLNLYQKFGNFEKHLAVSKELLPTAASNNLESAEKDVYLYQLEKVGGTIQGQVLSNAYRRNAAVHREKARQSAEYFSMIAKVKSKEKGKYLFLEGETYYAGGLMQEAYNAYKDSYQFARDERNGKAMKSSIEGMLATIGKKSFKDREKYYIPTYIMYLNFDRKSSRAKTIYEKLFNSYFSSKDFAKSESILDSYKKSYPKDYKTQEAMLAQIMDAHRKSGNIKEFNRLVGRIKNKEFVVSSKYGQQLNKLLLTMQFEDVEKAATSGDKRKALEGYIQIYKDENSSPKAKRNAAHNIAVLYFELGFADKTYEWASISSKLMSEAELLKFEETYLAISSELFNMQRFEKSASLSSYIYDKICKSKTAKKKQVFFKNAYLVSLSINNFQQANDIVNSGRKCGVSSKDIYQGHMEIVTVLGEQKRWQSYEEYLEKLYPISTLRPELIIASATLRDVYLGLSQADKVSMLNKKIIELYQRAKAANQKLSPEALWEVSRFRLNDMERAISQFHSIQLRFPDSTYNKLLENKISHLTQIAAMGDKVFAIRSGKGTIRAYQYLIETYQRFVSEIRNFVPPGKDPAYIKGFKGAMAQVERPLLEKSLSYLKEARELISKGNILSKDNYWFISSSRLPLKLEYHFDNGVLMDRGGKK